MKTVTPQDGFTPCISFLNSLGDITIGWEEENTKKVIALIKKKMKEGYVFFIVREPGRRGADPKLKSIEEIGKATQNKLRVSKLKSNNIPVTDDDLAKAMEHGVITVSRIAEKGKSVTTTRRAKTAEDVVASQSIAVKPVRGG